ncbi:UNVERIFIED_CONTAM: hypothetical protein Slati_4400000 [Sesamum latifolium]|uniref:Uncharacterized protein n=1 Tax=Sesamum latifolium TaxID=2727402 RepID=A0AAW2SR85_9LAMI
MPQRFKLTEVGKASKAHFLANNTTLGSAFKQQMKLQDLPSCEQLSSILMSQASL